LIDPHRQYSAGQKGKNMKKGNEEYLNHLAHIFLIGLLCFLVSLLGLSLVMWIKTPMYHALYIGLGAFLVQVIRSVFYVIRAWQVHRDRSHESSKKVGESSYKIDRE
jgi:uncharacterized membrane protein (DUF485 family)